MAIQSPVRLGEPEGSASHRKILLLCSALPQTTGSQASSMVSFWTLLLISQTHTGTVVLAPASLVFGVKFLAV